MILVCFFFPFIYFWIHGKIAQGCLAFVLQLFIIGWFPAFLWALIDHQNMEANKRTNRMIRSMRPKTKYVARNDFQFLED